MSKDAVYSALFSVPAGRVISYGELARLAGLPGAARFVGATLRNLPEDTRLPWHRVINSAGKLSLPEGSHGYQEQARRLASEGVDLLDGKVRGNPWWPPRQQHGRSDK